MPSLLAPTHPDQVGLTAVGVTRANLTESSQYTFDSDDNGRVIEDVKFSSQVTFIGVDGMTFRRCWFGAQQAFANYAVFKQSGTLAINLLFEDCDFGANGADAYKDVGAGFLQGVTYRRCLFYNFGDCIKLSHLADTLVEDCWLQPVQVGEKHTDGTQFNNGLWGRPSLVRTTVEMRTWIKNGVQCHSFEELAGGATRVDAGNAVLHSNPCDVSGTVPCDPKAEAFYSWTDCILTGGNYIATCADQNGEFKRNIAIRGSANNGSDLGLRNKTNITIPDSGSADRNEHHDNGAFYGGSAVNPADESDPGPIPFLTFFQDPAAGDSIFASSIPSAESFGTPTLTGGVPPSEDYIADFTGAADSPLPAEWTHHDYTGVPRRQLDGAGKAVFDRADANNAQGRSLVSDAAFQFLDVLVTAQVRVPTLGGCAYGIVARAGGAQETGYMLHHNTVGDVLLKRWVPGGTETLATLGALTAGLDYIFQLKPEGDQIGARFHEVGLSAPAFTTVTDDMWTSGSFGVHQFQSTDPRTFEVASFTADNLAAQAGVVEPSGVISAESFGTPTLTGGEQVSDAESHRQACADELAAAAVTFTELRTLVAEADWESASTRHTDLAAQVTAAQADHDLMRAAIADLSGDVTEVEAERRFLQAALATAGLRMDELGSALGDTEAVTAVMQRVAPGLHSAAVRTARLESLLPPTSIFASSIPSAESFGSMGVTIPAEPPSTLFHTPAELDVLLTRSLNGPFRVEDDAWGNSPGDWDRIVSNAAAFRSNPDLGKWTTAPNSRPSSPQLGYQLRDSAFRFRVVGTTADRDAVKGTLLDIADDPDVQFQTAWDEDHPSDSNEAFETANWVSRLLAAYDSLGAESFTTGERDKLNLWFYHAANYWGRMGNRDLDKLFDGSGTSGDRWNRIYSNLTNEGSATRNAAQGYAGSKWIHVIARYYNNRRSLTTAKLPGLAAVKLQRESFDPPTGTNRMTLAQLKKTAQLFVEQWLIFQVFPEGMIGEFERWKSSLPDLGWNYAASVLCTCLTVADVFARDGDRTLYEFTTQLGTGGDSGSVTWLGEGGSACNGADPDKDLLFAASEMVKYVDDTYNRVRPGGSGNADRIDSRNPRDGSDWRAIHDMNFAHGSRFFQLHQPGARADLVKNGVERTGVGMPLYQDNIAGVSGDPYPSSPAFIGQTQVYEADWGLHPGTCFMYVLMDETGIDPYPAA